MIKVLRSGDTFATLRIDAEKRFSKETIDRALRSAVSSLYADIVDRAFNEQGATLSNGGKPGNYSTEYLKRRKKKFGRNNTAINFVATQSMERNFKFERRAYNQYVMGLSEIGNKTETSNADKYRYLTERFGEFLVPTMAEITAYEKVLAAELERFK